MKQVSALFFCLMMMTMSLSGCLEETTSSNSQSINKNETSLTSWEKNISISIPDNYIDLASFSSDSKFVATLVDNGSEKAIQIWSTTNWTQIIELSNSDRINGFSFSPSGNIFTSYGGNQIHVWNMVNWTITETIELEYGVEFTMDYSDDGKYLATGHTNGEIYIWNTTNWNLVKALDYGFQIFSIDISSSIDMIAAGGPGRNVKVWETTNWSLVTTLSEHETWVQSTLFSPNGDYLISGSSKPFFSGGSQIIVWATSDWSIVKTITEDTDDVQKMNFLPTSNYFASTWSSNQLRIFEANTWTTSQTISIGAGPDYVEFSNNGRWLISLGEDYGSAQVWVKIQK